MSDDVKADRVSSLGTWWVTEAPNAWSVLKLLCNDFVVCSVMIL